MSLRVRGGWVAVDYAGPELTTIELGFEAGGETVWFGAFLDWIDGRRVAKVRLPVDGKLTVWLRVGNTTSRIGRLP